MKHCLRGRRARNFSPSRRGALCNGALALISLALEPPALWSASTAPVTVGWSTLKTLKSGAPATQASPARVLDGKRVSIPGFMVPLEDDAESVTEFLLVPYAGACIHVPPPPPNQIVHVLLTDHGKVKMTFVDPIVVTGTLKISTVQSPYGDVSYDLAADTVAPYPGS